jgi:hypothetical protein
MHNDLRSGIIAAAQALGIDPVDLATAISYETGGTFDPLIAGPTTKWGTHRGLIQWGEPQAQKYLGGDFSIPSQVRGIVAYLRDAGVKPGMGLLDIYSAINAGRVGRYGASDAAAGGAPGSVADKVAGMGAHRAKAEALLSGEARQQQAAKPGRGLLASFVGPSSAAAGPEQEAKKSVPAPSIAEEEPGRQGTSLLDLLRAPSTAQQEVAQMVAASPFLGLQDYVQEFLRARMRV